MRPRRLFRLLSQRCVTRLALFAACAALAACEVAPASVDVGGTVLDLGPGLEGGMGTDGPTGLEGGALDLAIPDAAIVSQPVASAGQPRLATVKEASYLDGSGSTVPAGCSVAWAAGAAAPAGVTITGGTTLTPQVAAPQVGTYPMILTVTCPGKVVSDTTALFVLARPEASFPDKTFVYQESAVIGDDTTTSSQGRKYVYDAAKHPKVPTPVTEVWIDIKGGRFQMTKESAGKFYRWVPGAGANESHKYWAFVAENRYATVPILATRVTPATASSGAKLELSVPLSKAFGGAAPTYSVLPHPDNPGSVTVTAAGGGKFTLGGAKLTLTHRFYLVAHNSHYRSLPRLLTLPLPVKAKGLPDLGVIYEVYIKHFADSDGDGIGDLPGLTSKLKYLSDDLGITTLQLMPIFKTPGTVSWGYGPGDYAKVHPDYGTLADLSTLLKTAHGLGLKVLIDFPINHVGTSFQQAAAAMNKPSSPYSDWFHFRDKNSRWFPWDFRDDGSRAHFFARTTSGTISLNLAQPDARAAVIAAVVKLLDLDGDGKFDDGADGFRLDYVKGPSRDFWRTLNRACQKARPGVALVGEAWTGTPTLGVYLTEGGFNGVYDFPFYYAVRGALKNHDSSGLYWHYQEAKKYYGSDGLPVPFSSNHDVSRVVADLKGENSGLAHAAASVVITAPGNPQLQYGDEVGMLSQTSNAMDQKNGGSFPWGGGDKAQTKDPAGTSLTKPDTLATQKAKTYSLLSHHKALIKARKQLPALSDPRSFGYQYSEFTDKQIYAVVRQSAKSRALVLVNLSNNSKTVSFSEGSKSTQIYCQGYGCPKALGPYGTHIYQLP